MANLEKFLDELIDDYMSIVETESNIQSLLWTWNEEDILQAKRLRGEVARFKQEVELKAKRWADLHNMDFFEMKNLRNELEAMENGRTDWSGIQYLKQLAQSYIKAMKLPESADGVNACYDIDRVLSVMVKLNSKINAFNAL